MKNRKVISVCPLTNVASVNIYDVRYAPTMEVLAGINNDKPEWLEVDDEMHFYLGELCIGLYECIRV